MGAGVRGSVDLPAHRLQDFGFRSRISEHLLDVDVLAPVPDGARWPVSPWGWPGPPFLG